MGKTRLFRLYMGGGKLDNIENIFSKPAHVSEVQRRRAVSTANLPRGCL